MKQDIRTCAYCGKRFVHQGRGQRKYCCVECNWKAQNEKKLRKRLEEAGEDYARRYYVKRMILAISKRQHGMKVRCEQCGREFPFRGIIVETRAAFVPVSARLNGIGIIQGADTSERLKKLRKPRSVMQNLLRDVKRKSISVMKR